MSDLKRGQLVVYSVFAEGTHIPGHVSLRRWVIDNTGAWSDEAGPVLCATHDDLRALFLDSGMTVLVPNPTETPEGTVIEQWMGTEI